MGRYGVTANAIAPRALTQMTEQLGGFDAKDGDFELFAPENVSPLVAYLASPAAARLGPGVRRVGQADQRARGPVGG